MARLIICIFVLALSGCQALTVSLIGAGAGTALRYGIDGVTYRTVTAPAPEVMQASLAALERMGIVVDGTDRFSYGEVIYARAENRTIEIEVEPISPKATRLRIAARNGSIFYDSATASEIVAQTERHLESAARGASSGTPAGATTLRF